MRANPVATVGLPASTDSLQRPRLRGHYLVALAPAKKMAAASTPTVALVPHAQAFAVSAVGLALFVTNRELAIAAVRDPEEARSARSHRWAQSASGGLA